MKSVFIVVKEITEVRGHGDIGKIKKIATYDGYNETQYPAFKSEQKAKDFIDKVCNFDKPIIIELKILD